jgi:hypothetical protein
VQAARALSGQRGIKLARAPLKATLLRVGPVLRVGGARRNQRLQQQQPEPERGVSGRVCVRGC